MFHFFITFESCTEPPSIFRYFFFFFPFYYYISSTKLLNDDEAEIPKSQIVKCYSGMSIQWESN